MSVQSDASADLAELAVFDFDGTCIDGQSGTLISTYLLKRGIVSLADAARLAWWGVRYKLHLPHRQQEPREIILGALNRHHVSDIAPVMAEIHDAVLVGRYRSAAVEEVRRRREEGMVTLIASATFAEVADRAAAYLGTDGYIATEMQRDATGAYTDQVKGDVIEGKAKLEAVMRWADEHIGRGRWRIACAYGDHHSDADLLAAARQPFAVCPGKTLKSLAHRRGWTILDWSDVS